MPKQEQTMINAGDVWNIIKKYMDLPSVADIKDHDAQLEEIDSRLASLTRDLAQIGAALTPIAAQVALGINKDTYNRYSQALAVEKDEKGNTINVSLDKSKKTEAEKQYINARCEKIKKYLEGGEFLTVTLAQSQDNRSNGGSLWIAQNIYGIGQEKGKDAVTISLEDILTAAARIKERDKA